MSPNILSDCTLKSITHLSVDDSDPRSDEVLMELPQSNSVGLAGYSAPDEPAGYEGAGVFVHRRHTSFGDLTNGLSKWP